MLGAISLDLFAVLLGGATALLPAFATDVLEVGPTGFGLLRSGPALGAAAMALLLARHPLRRHAGPRMFWAVAAFGVATLVFAVSERVWLSLVALAALGAADMVSVYVRQTLIQVVTPDHMRGRVASVSSVFISGSNELGEFESGVAARLLGPVGAAVFGGDRHARRDRRSGRGCSRSCAAPTGSTGRRPGRPRRTSQGTARWPSRSGRTPRPRRPARRWTRTGPGPPTAPASVGERRGAGVAPAARPPRGGAAAARSAAPPG